MSKGATVLAGGTPRPDLGPFFYEPTALSGVTEEMVAYADEIFGPLVSVYRVDSEEEAVERANDSDHGLEFGVRDLRSRARPAVWRLGAARAPSMSTTPTLLPGRRSTPRWAV